MNSFTIEKVNMGTVNIFADILTEAAEWLISENMKNWDPLNFSIENIVQKNDLNELYLCYSDDETAGCLKMQTVDKMFWPEVPEDESMYIHKLAVRRKFAGKGVSGAMIDWVKEQAILKKIKFVRLDCIANRDRLCRMYEKHGFIKKDERQVFGKYPTALFEYIIAAHDKYRMNSKESEITEKNYIRINNTNLSAEETAQLIVKKFKL